MYIYIYILMRAYVLLHPAYAPYISSTSLHMHHGAYAGICRAYAGGHMQGYIYIFVCGDFFIYPIGDVEYLVKHWTDFSKLCLILIMRSYDNTIKPYSSNIYIYNS